MNRGRVVKGGAEWIGTRMGDRDGGRDWDWDGMEEGSEAQGGGGGGGGGKVHIESFSSAPD